MCNKPGDSRGFTSNNSMPIVTFLSNGVGHADSFDRMESLNGTLDLDCSTVMDHKRSSTHLMSLNVSNSTDQIIISPSKKFEKVSMKELEEVLPSQSSVLDKVMLVQSRCAEVSSGFCDRSTHEKRVRAASAEVVLNRIDKVEILESSPTENLSLLERFLGCIQPLARWWSKTDKQDQTSTEPEVPWEVPFESISNPEWLGSGAQGVVFRGQFRGETIAFKKVNNKADTEIRHLRSLRHPNIVQFKGVCVEPRCYCILMEYCPYGQLYEMLHSGREVQPYHVTDWAKQIALGMQYLHTNKIIHRDLKSPNVLIGENDVLKISDFGVSREWNETSVKMSFAGTVAWMAPEVIRNEPCSLKVDVWSYGVLLWELLTCEIPYHNVDSTAIIWGVGSENLRLPVPATCPTEFRILIRMCWNAKPRNRPNFRQIMSHLDLACNDLLQLSNGDFNAMQQLWKEEIALHFQDQRIAEEGQGKLDVVLLRRRREELRHAQDIRRHYEDKLERVNDLCTDMQLLLEEYEEQCKRAKTEKAHYEQMNHELKQMQTKIRMQEFQHSLEHTWSLSKMELLRKLSTALLSERSTGFPLAQNVLHGTASRSMDALNQFDRFGKSRADIAPSLWSDRTKWARLPGKRKVQCPICGSAVRSVEWPAKMKRSNAAAGATDWNAFFQLLNQCLDLKATYKCFRSKRMCGSMDELHPGSVAPPSYEYVMATEWFRPGSKGQGGTDSKHRNVSRNRHGRTAVPITQKYRFVTKSRTSSPQQGRSNPFLKSQTMDFVSHSLTASSSGFSSVGIPVLTPPIRTVVAVPIDPCMEVERVHSIFVPQHPSVMYKSMITRRHL
ncbi:M3K12 [Fasciola gigantica]|uniref:mitogen-activated protein kinase kinase kinase n=1 Tax=Fasciola gigantica TaxID=46835 RepID=A0A504YSI4_FASGI|nr:M3K12 [Fasciola gigantica]